MNKMSSHTKAENLIKLKQNSKLSHVEELLYFTVEEWKKNEKILLKKIINTFYNQEVIIRSSAIGEDSNSSSNAGNFSSFQHVSTVSKNLKQKINLVIKSYHKKKNYNKKNQILIQTQSSQITTSGVIFTKHVKNNGPYYNIDYEDGKQTDSVTKGISKDSVSIFRKSDVAFIPKKWKKLISCVKEIESIFHSDELDIEFGITNSKVIIFQVRPITQLSNLKSAISELQLKNIIRNNSKRFSNYSKKNSKLFGNKTIFSDMSDWNPSEIIGNEPNNLDFSLYNYLIMQKIWHKSRSELGYSDFNPTNLMIKFGNKPYVDLRASFNSLIPETLPKSIKKKLMSFFFQKLEKNPHLHDKVEFNILFTCFDLTTPKRLKELKKYGFSENEIKKIHDELLLLTNSIIQNFPIYLKESKTSIEKLEIKRKNILKQISKQNYIPNLKQLLDDCQIFGTFQFSKMARIAFVATAILKSLEHQKLLNDNFLDNFMANIQTPLSDFQDDLHLLNQNKITRNYFLKKYGHLRPGTYDITALRYSQQPDIINHNYTLKKSKKSETPVLNMKILKSISNSGLKFTNTSPLEFVKNALVIREQLKFEFTKNLSEALEIIKKIANSQKIPVHDICHLTINEILNMDVKNISKSKDIIKEKIKKAKNTRIKNSQLIHPPIIFSQKDFFIMKNFHSKPNFITSKKLKSQTINLDDDFSSKKIKNSIILIENADPGFDWIFNFSPAGLITKYGGVASHMAIRCGELNLPAAIGCGELLFDKLLNASKLNLDCHNETITILQNKKTDRFSEEKRILRELGYIK